MNWAYSFLVIEDFLHEPQGTAGEFWKEDFAYWSFGLTSLGQDIVHISSGADLPGELGLRNLDDSLC
mgnify:FL=1